MKIEPRLLKIKHRLVLCPAWLTCPASCNHKKPHYEMAESFKESCATRFSSYEKGEVPLDCAKHCSRHKNCPRYGVWRCMVIEEGGERDLSKGTSVFCGNSATPNPEIEHERRDK